MPSSRLSRPRPRRRPTVEGLEIRSLLSVSTVPNPSYDAWIRSDVARGVYQVDGSGLAAAVIDTGIDYTHPALGGGYGPGRVVEGGYDLAMKDADPRAGTWSHGTMVSGLIASRDGNGAGGVAPGADLVALRVFGDDNRGSFDTIADALQWVVDHHEEYEITVVNLSISDNQTYASDWWSHDGGIGERIAGLVEELARLRIPVVTATGNGYRGQEGVGFTAILPGTISVTGTDGDGLWASAQRLGAARGGASATDLAAPATGLMTTTEDHGFGRVDGTSFAAPLVTGAILLLQQIYRGRFGVLPRVDELSDWLRRGADPIRDASGFTIGRLNVERSAGLIPTPAGMASTTTTIGPAPGAATSAGEPNRATASPPASATARVEPATPNPGRAVEVARIGGRVRARTLPRWLASRRRLRLRLQAARGARQEISAPGAWT